MSAKRKETTLRVQAKEKNVFAMNEPFSLEHIVFLHRMPWFALTAVQ